MLPRMLVTDNFVAVGVPSEFSGSLTLVQYTTNSPLYGPIAFEDVKIVKYHVCISSIKMHVTFSRVLRGGSVRIGYLTKFECPLDT
jgi:hypothetical protein